METLTLNRDSKIYDSFLKMLGQFKKNEVQIISKNESFENTKKQLQQELKEIDEGKAIFLTMEEFEIESK